MTKISDILGYTSKLGDRSLLNTSQNESEENVSEADTFSDKIFVDTTLYDVITSFSENAYFPAGRMRELYPGSYGHGDIEDIALGKTGDIPLFKQEDINKIYLGNWLRDFSQIIAPATVKSYYENYKMLSDNLTFIPKSARNLIKKRHTKFEHSTLIKLMKILAIKEFIYEVKVKEAEEKSKGKPKEQREIIRDNYYTHKTEYEEQFMDITRDTLGMYRPEEHLDNPKRLVDTSQMGVYFSYEYMDKGDSKPKKKIMHMYNGEIKAQRPDVVGQSLIITADEKSPQGIAKNIKKFIVEDIPYTNEEIKIEKRNTRQSLAKEKVNRASSYTPEDYLNGSEINYNLTRPSAITYMLQQFRLAVYYGKNKKGFMHFGAGLHVLEDFYAHTNFCELSLIKYGKTKTQPFVVIFDEALLEDQKVRGIKASDYPLVSGLFDLDDTMVSIIPKLIDSVFSTEKTEYVYRLPNELKFSEAIIEEYLKDKAQTEKEIIQGVYTKDENEKKKMIDEISFKDPVLGITLTPSFTLSWFYRYLAGVNLWATNTVPEEDDNDVQEILKGGMRYVAEQFHNAMQDISVYISVVAGGMLNTLDDIIIASQEITNKNYGEQGNDPTHSQVAKDHPEHHFNTLAGELAVASVYEIGSIMKGIWNKEKNMSLEYLEKVLTQKYFRHPSDTDWMEKLVKDWIEKHPDEVERAEYKNSLEYTEALGENALERFKYQESQFREIIEKKLKELEEARKKS